MPKLTNNERYDGKGTYVLAADLSERQIARQMDSSPSTITRLVQTIEIKFPSMPDYAQADKLGSRGTGKG